MAEDQKDEKIEIEKEIEVVNGNGSELEVSPVFEHLNAIKPKTKKEKEKEKKEKIIIPEVKKK